MVRIGLVVLVLLHALPLLDASGQTFIVEYDARGKVSESVTKSTELSLKPSSFYSIVASAADSIKFEVLVDGVLSSTPTFKRDGENQSLTIKDDADLKKVANSRMTIRMKDDTNKVFARLKFPPYGLDDGSNIERAADRWVLRKYDGVLQYTSYGLVLSDVKWAQSNNVPSGPDVVHLFFDEFGNSIITTVPQGISNMQYVVHMVYLARKKQVADDISYSVKQKKGRFSGNLVFRNEGMNAALNSLLTGALDPKKETDLEWNEEISLLATSTDDIEFDIVKSKRSDGATGSIATHTINMSTVYNGSFDVGLLNSNLKNPSYTLAALPSDPSKNTVLEKDAKNRGQVSVMATLYTSPVLLIRYLFQLAKNDVSIPSFQLYGRNYLYDHEIFERVYPTLGVSLSDASFQNLFFGFNFELARGASIFVGAHYGKVNTFDGKGTFVFGGSTITQADFDSRTDQSWRIDWAFGVNLDFSIAKNLFKP